LQAASTGNDGRHDIFTCYRHSQSAEDIATLYKLLLLLHKMYYTVRHKNVSLFGP